MKNQYTEHDKYKSKKIYKTVVTKEKKLSKISKLSKLSKLTTKSGGAKLGQGSYGCVVTPPVDCLKNPLLRKNHVEQNISYVSKIVDSKYSEVAFSELNIGKKILSIDRKQNFLTPLLMLVILHHKNIKILFI